jgi:hypothetical protein
MSIEKSEKFVAVTTTYVENKLSEAPPGPQRLGISFIAISGLDGEPYTVVHDERGWTSPEGVAAVLQANS